MTNDELKQAAERALHLAKKGNSIKTREMSSLVERLAGHYLAQLAEDADGDEPVTEEWLQSIGFSDRLILKLQGKWELLAFTYDRWCLNIENSPNDYYGCQHDYDLPQPKTRKEVRQLLKALGITTKGAER